MTSKADALDRLDEAVLDVCRKYRADLAHGRHVSTLAETLFEAFLPLHGLSPAERTILRHAGLLHDIGYFVRKKGHHRHGAYLVREDEQLAEYPEEARDLLARAVRNHRRRAREGPKNYPRARREAILWLSALLRVADALDYEHEQRALIAGVRVRGRGFEIRVSGLDPLRFGEHLHVKSDLLAQMAGGALHFEREEP